MLAILGLAACGDETVKDPEAEREPYVGVYRAMPTAVSKYLYRDVVAYLGRGGIFRFCWMPETRRASGTPLIGTWRIVDGKLVEFTVTHEVWSDAVRVGAFMRGGCGPPEDPVIPRLPPWKVIANLEDGGFVWPVGDPVPFKRVPTPPWAEEHLNYTVPAEVRWGYDPTGSFAGSYRLDRQKFVETLREFGFRNVSALAANSKATLELNADGAYWLVENRAWKQEKWREPKSFRGHWLTHEGILYLVRPDGNRPDVRLVRRQEGRLLLHGNDKGPPDEHPDWTDWFELPLAFVRAGE